MKKYTASYDFLVKSILVLVVILLIGSIVLKEYSATLILTSVFIVSYVLSPQYYEVHSSKITIHRFWKNVELDTSQISLFRILEKSELKFAIRTIGVGGMFGYYGWYYNKMMGKMLWYNTQRKNNVLIQMKDGKKIILSPDLPQEMVESYQNNLKLG